MDQDIVEVKTKFDEYLQEMPEEVQDFMWSDLYDIIIIAIQQTLSLSENQTALIKNAGYTLLMEAKTMEDVAKELKGAGMPDDLIMKSLYLINTEIITRAENITEFYSQSPEDETVPTTTPAASTPSDILARMNQTLVKPTTLASTKRVYTTDPTVTASPQNPKPLRDVIPVSTNPTIDPYRELPDEK